MPRCQAGAARGWSGARHRPQRPQQQLPHQQPVAARGALQRQLGAGAVSRAFPSAARSILTEIYLCHACSYHEVEDGNARTGTTAPTRAACSRARSSTCSAGERWGARMHACTQRGGADIVGETQSVMLMNSAPAQKSVGRGRADTADLWWWAGRGGAMCLLILIY
jgi:hypothetical protein